ncbi:MAG: FHIPEP family type III secretion protein, partial [Pirellulaceae bacterium]|nr:FHIPEP family type III secretion protein [Pirellulaceae bacterium]
MDIITLANRYLGKVVSVAISGHQRIEGTLASVHHDCLRVTQCLVLHDTDDQGWYGSIRRSEDDFNSGPRLPETLVHIHCVNSITCLDEELELDDVDDGQRQIIVNGSDTDVEPEPEETSPIDQLWEHRLWSEALLIEIGVELIKLADTSRGGQLLDTVRDCRKQIAKDWGLLVPKIRIRDNINMPYNEYRVLVTECAAATGVVHINKMLAIEVTGATSVPGVETTEPVFDIPAKWIDPDDRQQAEMQGCTVVEPVTIIATHLKEVIEHSLAELLTMEQVSEL